MDAQGSAPGQNIGERGVKLREVSQQPGCLVNHDHQAGQSYRRIHLGDVCHLVLVQDSLPPQELRMQAHQGA
jgi:hypothetical protein